jgi:hypothetical protein
MECYGSVKSDASYLRGIVLFGSQCPEKGQSFVEGEADPPAVSIRMTLVGTVEG